jgi:uncharacterized membrane protein
MSGGAIASLTGVGVLIIFMIQNTEEVTLNFLIWNLFGALVWFGLGVLRRHRRRKARREGRRN